MNVQSWKRNGDGLIVQTVAYDGENIRAIEDFVDFGKLSLHQTEPYVVTITGRKPLLPDDYVVKYSSGDLEVLSLNELCEVFNLIPEGTDDEEDEVPIRHMVEDENWIEAEVMPTEEDEGGD